MLADSLNALAVLPDTVLAPVGGGLPGVGHLFALGVLLVLAVLSLWAVVISTAPVKREGP